MTIKELLEADNTIDRIDVTIRDEKNYKIYHAVLHWERCGTRKI